MDEPRIVGRNDETNRSRGRPSHDRLADDRRIDSSVRAEEAAMLDRLLGVEIAALFKDCA